MKKNYKVSIVGGAGHVGLPLAFSFAKKKCKVICVDNDLNKIKLINSGKSPFREEGLDNLIKKSKLFDITFTNQINSIQKSDFVIVTIGTPIDEYLNPDFRFFFNNLKKIIHTMNSNQILILRSTLYPGTCDRIINFLKKKRKKIYLAYCPERIAQGVGMKEISKIPQIISGSNQYTESKCVKLFNLISKKVIRCNFLDAELSKLFCNSWRYIKFAVANQFYSICSDNNINYEKLRNIISLDYPRAKDLPRSGFAAGPCLLKDTMQLSAFSRKSFTFGAEAMLTNETLPDVLINNLKLKMNIQNKKVGILGMAFKKDNDDARDSLAFKLKKKLEYEGCKVLCSDEFIKKSNFVTTKQLLQKCKIIFLGCPHTKYQKLNFKNKILVDCWGMFHKI